MEGGKGERSGFKCRCGADTKQTRLALKLAARDRVIFLPLVFSMSHPLFAPKFVQLFARVFSFLFLPVINGEPRTFMQVLLEF